MFRLQNLRKMRVVHLHQWPLLQLHAEIGHPEGKHANGHRNVLENSPAKVQVARGVFEIRFDQPERVERAGKNHPLAHPHQREKNIPWPPPPSRFFLRFRSRESSMVNGMSQWKMKSNVIITPQPPRM